MGYLGSFIIDDTCTFYANSHTPTTGAAVDADAVPGYRVYEDESGTPLLTGSMALLDDANTVGFYSEQITLSAANGFELGKSYCVRVTIVVGGATGTLIHTLQMGARVDTRLWNALTTVALPLIPTTAGRTLDVSAGGEAGVDWANVGSPTTTVDLSGTTIKTTQKVDVDTIKTNPVANGGTVTFPTNATIASTTNITAGTVAVATALGAAYDAAKTAASPSQVNAEVVDALATDTYAEPGQGAPAATTTLAAKLNYLFKWMRNKLDNDGAVTQFYDDAGTTVDQKRTTSESGGVVTKGEIGSGP